MSLKKLQNQLDSKHLLSTKHWGRQNFMTCQIRCFSIATSLSFISTPTNLLNFNSWQGVLVLKKQNEKTPPSGFVQHHRWILPSVLHYGLWHAAATFGLCRGVTCPCPTGASSVFFRVIGKKVVKKVKRNGHLKKQLATAFSTQFAQQKANTKSGNPRCCRIGRRSTGERPPHPKASDATFGSCLTLGALDPRDPCVEVHGVFVAQHMEGKGCKGCKGWTMFWEKDSDWNWVKPMHFFAVFFYVGPLWLDFEY